jgi:hypothetical protein
VAPPWWKSAELFPPIHKQKKEDEEVPVAPPCWQSEELFSPAHTLKSENEVGKKLVAPPWQQAGELLPPATSQEIGAGEIPLAPAGCFKCAMEFKNKSSKFIYTHYCIHFQKALLALGKKMYPIFQHHTSLSSYRYLFKLKAPFNYVKNFFPVN